MSHTFKYYNINCDHKLIIALFIMSVTTFNTAIFAQPTDQNTATEHTQNFLKFIITKDTKDSQLESIQKKLAEKDATISFAKITRNGQKEIIGIKIDFAHNGKNSNFFVNSSSPIMDVTVSLNVNENELTVGQSTKNLSQSFEIIEEDGDKKVKTSGKDQNVFVYSTDDTQDKEVKKITVVGKDGKAYEVKKEKKIYVMKSDSTKDSDETEEVVFVKKNKKDTVWIKKDVKNIIWTDEDGTDVEIIAVEKGNNFQIITTGDEQPLILLDGKEISQKDMDKIKPETIENVNVLKGDKATEKHGKKGEHGVIDITTKKD